jgi:hypothetical protein
MRCKAGTASAYLGLVSVTARATEARLGLGWGIAAVAWGIAVAAAGLGPTAQASGVSTARAQ